MFNWAELLEETSIKHATTQHRQSSEQKQSFITIAVYNSYSNVQGHIRSTVVKFLPCSAAQLLNHACMYCTFPCKCQIVCVSVERGQICKFGGFSLWTCWPRRLRWAARPYADGRHRAHPCLCPPPCYRQQSATWQKKYTKALWRRLRKSQSQILSSMHSMHLFDATRMGLRTLLI